MCVCEGGVGVKESVHSSTASIWLQEGVGVGDEVFPVAELRRIPGAQLVRENRMSSGQV